MMSSTPALATNSRGEAGKCALSQSLGHLQGASSSCSTQPNITEISSDSNSQCMDPPQELELDGKVHRRCVVSALGYLPREDVDPRSHELPHIIYLGEKHAAAPTGRSNLGHSNPPSNSPLRSRLLGIAPSAISSGEPDPMFSPSTSSPAGSDVLPADSATSSALPVHANLPRSRSRDSGHPRPSATRRFSLPVANASFSSGKTHETISSQSQLNSRTASYRNDRPNFAGSSQGARPSSLQAQSPASEDVPDYFPHSSTLEDSFSDDEERNEWSTEGAAAMGQTQTLMQMLSMVGTSLMEAERDGLLESSVEDEGDDPFLLAKLFSPHLHGADDGGAANALSGDRYLARAEKPPLRSVMSKTISSLLLADIPPDDQSTPIGGSTPLYSSMATIPQAARQHLVAGQQSSLAHTQQPSDAPKEIASSASSSMASSLASLRSIGGEDDNLLGASMHAISSAFIVHQESSDQPVAPAPSKQKEGIETQGEGGSIPVQSLSTSQLLRTHRSHRDHLSTKVRELFNLSEGETVQSCHPCWLFRTILLRGYVYFTNSYLCFYAYLPSKGNRATRAGPLMKRTRRTMRFSKHWAVLRGNALSWYESNKDPYFPQGHIDLRTVQDVSSVAGDGKGKESQFTVETPERTFLFSAPSNDSRDVWVQAILKAVFRARNDGDSVRIGIPFETILDVEESSSSSLDSSSVGTPAAEPAKGRQGRQGDPLAGGMGDMVAIKVVEGGTDFALDEFHFLNFGPRRDCFLSDLKRVVAEMAGRQMARRVADVSVHSQSVNKMSSEHGDALSTTVTRRQIDPGYPPSSSADTILPIIPLSERRERESSRHPVPRGGILQAVPSWISRGSSEASRLLMQAPAAGSKFGAAVLGSISGAERQARRVSEIWNASSAQAIRGVPSMAVGLANDEQVDSQPMAPSTQSNEEQLYRTTFPLARADRLLMTAQSSLYRVLPTKGLLFISDRHICFRSSGLATRTMGRTLMMLPIGDVITVARHRAFQPGQHGLIVVVRGHEEVFLEFSSVDLRNECCERLEQMLEEALMRPTADISIGKQDDLILKDLSDKLEATSISTSLPSSSSSDADTQDWESGSVSASMFKSQSSDFLSFLPKQPLHITMLSIGSRGDVQPYIALAKALMADGHRVRIATHDEFSAWIEGHNIEFSAVGGDPAELMRICEQNGTFTVGFVREGLLKFRGWLDDLLLSSWRACHGTDVIIESPSAIAGIHVAEAMQIPYFRAFTMPWTRTRAYPHAFAVPHSKAGGSYNYISYVIFDQVFWRAASRQINRWRQETLRLKSTTYDLLEQHKVPFLYNFSPNLVPKPLDWYEWIHVTGFWFLDNPGETSGRSWAAPDDLVAFINTTKAQKRKLVYIGWGSIVVSNAAAMDECVGEAVRKSGVCAIVSRGWSDRLSENKGTPSEAFSSPDIFRVDSVPHDWLFPQLDAACHHGGAGTLGASLRAGLPTIIKPYFGDQFFWGQQVESLGVGTCVKECTAENLAAALRKATQDVRQIERARQLGERIRSENGVQAAVTAFYRELEYARSLIKTDSRLHTTNSEVQASNTVDGASPSQPHAEELHERSSRAIDAINTPSNRPRSTRSSSADSNWSILSP